MKVFLYLGFSNKTSSYYYIKLKKSTKLFIKYRLDEIYLLKKISLVGELRLKHKSQKIILTKTIILLKNDKSTIVKQVFNKKQLKIEI